MNENSICRESRDGLSRKSRNKDTQAWKDRTCVENLKWFYEDGEVTRRGTLGKRKFYMALHTI